MPDSENPLHPPYHSLMQRLLQAGLITSYEEANEEYDQLQVQWNPDYHAPLGGKTAYRGLLSLLQDLCPESPLTADEQALLLILREPPSVSTAPPPAKPTTPKAKTRSPRAKA